MAQLCYLCGKAIAGQVSDDHVVPATFIDRDQPKARGYDYAGKLPTHPECNNRFGPETYVSKAIDFIIFLEGEDGQIKVRYRDRPDVEVQALDASKLPGFTQRDIEFFKLIDVREIDQADWSNPDFFQDKIRTNPKRDSLGVALSVLAKSAAALLVKRELKHVPKEWRIYAIPYIGASEGINFDELIGPTLPFATEFRAWMKLIGEGPDWMVIYRAKSVLIYFVFVFGKHNAVAHIKEQFSDAQVFEFTGESLNAMLQRGWREL